jgi:hypothetical protein
MKELLGPLRKRSLECGSVYWLEKKHGSRVARIKKRRVELSRKPAKVCP